MNKIEIEKTLREILKKEDIDSDSLTGRKKSEKHEDTLGVLLENVSLLVTYLRFEADCSRRELFLVRKALEE